MNCRHCSYRLDQYVIDLGSSPPSNAYLSQEALSSPEKWFPLRILVCEKCWLVQTEDFTAFDELFSEDYAYFSSFSTSWLDHCKRYYEKVTERFQLGADSCVVEVASNDGYLLQYFQDNGIPCFGIEPTESTAKAAREKGIETISEFFTSNLAEGLSSDDRKADLTMANNVLAHVPDINDFVSGFSILLKDDGVATFEFPSVTNLICEGQFDTIYHEHFSYLSLSSVERVFESNGLSVFDVEELPTHGGSLRIYAQKQSTGTKKITEAVGVLRAKEARLGVDKLEFYKNLQQTANDQKDACVQFLITARKEGKKVAGYGAAAKGNTFLNYAGVRPDWLSFVVDLNPAKQDMYLPGSQIPIVSEEYLKKEKPDYVLILPWNLKDEISEQLAYVKEWGGQFVTAIPELKIW